MNLDELRRRARKSLLILRDDVLHTWAYCEPNEPNVPSCVDDAIVAIESPWPSPARIDFLVGSIGAIRFRTLSTNEYRTRKDKIDQAAIDLARFGVSLSLQPELDAPLHPPQPDASASWLVARVARVLPVAHRVRYSQEFLGELSELAQRGRVAQVRYSLCLLLHVFGLRRALRDVVPEVESW